MGRMANCFGGYALSACGINKRWEEFLGNSSASHRITLFEQLTESIVRHFRPVVKSVNGRNRPSENVRNALRLVPVR